MGKPIRAQRIGNGSPTYRANSFNWLCDAKYINTKGRTITCFVNDILHDPGRTAPVVELISEDGEKFYTVAWEGSYVGQEIQIGPDAELKYGNILPLKKIPEGFPVCNIELEPYDGGKLSKSSGSYAVVHSKLEDKVVLRMPSGKMKEFHPECRACIGVVAGGGRLEKPLRKAGNAFYLYHAKGRKWPKTRGIAMNAVDHPNGGKSGKKKSGPSTVSRNAPPGRKVGHIAARRTGRKK